MKSWCVNRYGIVHVLSGLSALDLTGLVWFGLVWSGLVWSGSSEPAFGTYGFICCMKTVGKVITGFLGVMKRVIMSLCKLIKASVPAK